MGRTHSRGYVRTATLLFVMSALAVVLEGSSIVYSSPHSPLANGWQRLEPGLELGVFFPSPVPEGSNALVRVLRIDLRWFELRLLNASNPAYRQLLSAKMWCTQHGLVAAINASMYQTDHLTSVSLMRTKTHTNNARLTRDKAILAFDRQNPGVPLVKIIDRECEDFEAWKDKYSSFVQSIRMISCKGKNVWNQQQKKWSTAAIGTDEEGKVLFIHVRSPFSTHDLINILVGLPLKLSRLMYVEGGTEAQLYVQSGTQGYDFIGSYDSGFGGDERESYAMPIPNVVGIARRDKPLE